MGRIIKFPRIVAYSRVEVRGGRWHDISVRILDTERPEEARWHLQFAMQRAASFRCLDGFTDKVAHSREWHDFEVGRTDLLRRFLIDIEQLVADERTAIKVDGVRVRHRSWKTA